MDTEQYTPEGEGLEDFDAFWSSRKRRVRTTTIMGETITLPPALPLQFDLEAKKLARSKRDKDVRKLVAILFGEDTLARWTERGMDLEQFMVLLAWAPRVITGQDVSLAEVADAVAEQLAREDGDQPGEA